MRIIERINKLLFKQKDKQTQEQQECAYIYRDGGVYGTTELYNSTQLQNIIF